MDRPRIESSVESSGKAPRQAAENKKDSNLCIGSINFRSICINEMSMIDLGCLVPRRFSPQQKSGRRPP